MIKFNNDSTLFIDSQNVFKAINDETKNGRGTLLVPIVRKVISANRGLILFVTSLFRLVN